MLITDYIFKCSKTGPSNTRVNGVSINDTAQILDNDELAYHSTVNDVSTTIDVEVGKIQEEKVSACKTCLATTMTSLLSLNRSNVTLGIGMNVTD